MDNIRTIEKNYEAFGRGDIDAILEHMADDVRFEYHPTGNTMQEADIPAMRFAREKRTSVASSKI